MQKCLARTRCYSRDYLILPRGPLVDREICQSGPRTAIFCCSMSTSDISSAYFNLYGKRTNNSSMSHYKQKIKSTESMGVRRGTRGLLPPCRAKNSMFLDFFENNSIFLLFYRQRVCPWKFFALPLKKVCGCT